MLARHVPPHPIHETGIWFPGVLGGLGLVLAGELVVDVQEDIQGVHDGTLARRRTIEVELLEALHSLIHPTRLPGSVSLGTDPPWTTEPEEGCGVDGFPNRVEDVGELVDDSLQADEVSVDLRNGGVVGGVRKGLEGLEDLEHLHALQFDGGRNEVELSLGFSA